LIIAAAIKLTSEGPVLFRQKRLGQYGKKFLFFKFRSMYTATDHAIHEQYVSSYIAGTLTGESQDNHPPVYKMTNDPRITRIGKVLRRTSLDEFPQFFNVLRGQMSLVGPRPPLPYEYERYGVWHRRRLLAVKPGITGLWQVAGRSKVPFDEMVRLDLEYAKSWSLWMDIKILFRTPLAVLNSDGAY
jgi:lipopolysaccharide/colanic/teichoic acid biosynthesis glycosyltransferase